jgi:hypothetical protein
MWKRKWAKKYDKILFLKVFSNLCTKNECLSFNFSILFNTVSIFNFSVIILRKLCMYYEIRSRYANNESINIFPKNHELNSIEN